MSKFGGAVCLLLISVFISSVSQILLKNIPLSMQPILESTGYIFVTVMGYFFLKERIGKRKMAGIALILLGILIFSM